MIDLLHRQVNWWIIQIRGGGALEVMGSSLCSVWSFYEKLLVREEPGFPCNAIWTQTVPRKVCFSTRLATRGVILTAENLESGRLSALVSATLQGDGRGCRLPISTLRAYYEIMVVYV